MAWPQINRNSNPNRKQFLPSQEQLDKIKRPEIIICLMLMIPFLSSAGPFLYEKTRITLLKYVLAVVVVTFSVLLPFRKKIMDFIVNEGTG